jgi:hypothetical protein
MNLDALDAVVILLTVLATARLTRLVNKDEVTDPIRIAVIRRYGEDSRPAYFLGCPWCVSIWVGFALVPYALWITDLSLWLWPLLALAASWFTGITAAWDGEEVEVEYED